MITRDKQTGRSQCPQIPDHMKYDLARLIEITRHCRVDMHEPDEGGLYAYVDGDMFENTALDIGEIELVIVDVTGDEDISHRFNICTLVALARKANLE